jgi:hypothetical protein
VGLSIVFVLPNNVKAEIEAIRETVVSNLAPHWFIEWRSRKSTLTQNFSRRSISNTWKQRSRELMA